MNDNVRPHPVRPHPDIENDETIVRLLRVAGPRPAVPEWDAAVVKAAAKKRWCLKVAALNSGRSHSGRSRRRWGLWGGALWGGGTLSAAAVVILSAAAVVLLAVGWMISRPIATLEGFSGSVAVHSFLRSPHRIDSGASIKKGDGVEVMADSRAAFRASGASSGRASGGASVRLDSGTRVYWVSSTVLELEEGTVYVDSEPDAGEIPAAETPAAIEIRTALGVVREIGTQFEVRVQATDDGSPELRVRVREGRVDLDQKTRASAGEELAVGADGSVTRGVVSAYGSQWDWTRAIAPTFDSEQRTLGELLAWAVREGGWRLEYADPEAEKAAAEAVLWGYGSIEGSKLREGIELGCLGANLACHFEGDRLVVASTA